MLVFKLDASGNLEWVKDLGGTQGAEAFGIAVSAGGSVYATGQFDGRVNFDPGESNFTLTAPANEEDAFVSKLDSAGDFVWAEGFGGGTFTQGVAVAVGADGSVYTTGNYSGTADFGATPITSAGSQNIYVAKLSSAGNVVWVKSLGGSGYDNVNGMAVASDGSVYTTGSFLGSANFNPGSGGSLTSAGGSDIFISKLNSAGQYAWAEGIGGAGDDWGQGVALGPDGSVYVTGDFAGTVNFNPGGTANLTSAGTGNNENNFVLRLSSAGNYLWAGATGSANNDASGRIDDLSESVAVTYDGSIYTTGQFESSANFNPTSSGTFNLSGTLAAGDDGFLAKFTAPTAGDVVPAVTLSAPALSTSSTPSVTVTATEAGSNMPNGTKVYVDVDLNDDGTFTDPGDTGYATGTLTNGAVTFNLPSLPDGTYHVRARVSDAGGNQGFSAVSTMVVASSPTITLAPLAATEEVPLNDVLLAHFQPFGTIGAYAAVVNWGDGPIPSIYTTAASGGGYIVQHDPSDPSQGFDVYGSHTYIDALSGATFSVEVTDGKTTLTATNNNFSVADQQITVPVIVATNVPPTTPQGVALGPITDIATFIDPAGQGDETPADFTATINWGDGNSSPGTVVWLANLPGGAEYEVNAPGYTYVQSGMFNVSVTVQHDALPPVISPSVPITVASTTPIVVSTTPSLSGGTLPSATTSLVVTFNMPMANADGTNEYTLEHTGADGLLGSADDVDIPISSVNYVPATNTATLTFPGCPRAFIA